MNPELVLIILLSLITVASVAYSFLAKKKAGQVPQDMTFALLMKELELSIPEFIATYGVVTSEEVADEEKAKLIASKFYDFFMNKYLLDMAQEDPNIFGTIYSFASIIPEDKMITFITKKFIFIFKEVE
jgi:hypothetical protein